MTRRIIWMSITAIAALVLFYLSRFWIFSFWSREGLFGVSELRPQGGLLARWLRGTDFAPFELLIWVVGFFVILTWLEKAYGKINQRKK